jgi:integrase
VRSRAIDDWLRSLGCAPRTRNTIHTGVRTFFSWAKSRGYLPRNEPTEAEALTKVKAGETNTEIFTPAQMRLLLHSAPARMVPYLALGAFAGLRAAEMARLDWSAIDLTRRIITIRADQAKTASRRLVPITDNLAAWLAPHAARGRLRANPVMQKKAAALAKVLGIEWPPNGLRHSFITYRIAQVKSAEQVALEAGNSPAIIFKHYRELATEAQSAEWFGILPAAPSL